MLRDRGPSLRTVCALFNKYYRQAISLHKKWDPAWQKSRFKMLGTPEQRERTLHENLERIYGDANFIEPPEWTEPAVQPAATPSTSPQRQDQLGQDQLGHGQDQLGQRKDITTVRLVRLPCGLLGYDYSTAT